jgi:hypothetical protein
VPSTPIEQVIQVSFHVIASSSACGNLGKRKKAKTFLTKPQNCVVFKRQAARANCFEMLSRKVPVQSRRFFLAYA